MRTHWGESTELEDNYHDSRVKNKGWKMLYESVEQGEKTEKFSIRVSD